MDNYSANIKQLSESCTYSIAESACEILTAIYKNTSFAVAKTGKNVGIIFGPTNVDTRIVKLIVKSLDKGDQSGYDRCYCKYKDIIESFLDARHDILAQETFSL